MLLLINPQPNSVSESVQPESAQEQINGRLYREADLVQTYASVKLSPSEAVALVRQQEHVVGRRVLDLGCGAGRLAAYLRPLTEHYVGVDVSRHMVEYCQQIYPALTFLEGDMRDLRMFSDDSFDSVFAVANLFDAVTHPERLQVLGEVLRILRTGGALIFSAHNRNYRCAGQGPRLRFSRNPVTQLNLLVEYWQARRNHLHIKPLHRSEVDYALFNDSGNNYHTLHYYVTRQTQSSQLQETGFELVECLDERGLRLLPGMDDSANPSVTYIAKKR